MKKFKTNAELLAYVTKCLDDANEAFDFYRLKELQKKGYNYNPTHIARRGPSEVQEYDPQSEYNDLHIRFFGIDGKKELKETPYYDAFFTKGYSVSRVIGPFRKFAQLNENNVAERLSTLEEPQDFVMIPETIEYMVKGKNGESVSVKLEEGGYLSLSGDSAIQKDEFEKTYAPCDFRGDFIDEKLRKEYGQKSFLEKIREKD